VKPHKALNAAAAAVADDDDDKQTIMQKSRTTVRCQSTFIHSNLGNPLKFSGNVSQPRFNLASLTYQVAWF
jgi:hypothetical protein